MTDNRLQNIVAEAAVLGSMILDRECIEQAKKALCPESFSKPEHGHIFTALVGLYEAGGKIDLIVLRDELIRRDLLKACGGVDYLVRVTESVPTAANIEYYARAVQEACTRRKIDELGQGMAQKAGGSDTVHDILRDVQTQLEEIPQPIRPDSSGGLKRLIEDTAAGHRRLLSSCWPTVDSFTRAFLPQTITLLCGNAGASKSFMLCQLLSHFVDNGVRSSVLELEESREYHQLRILAQRSRCPGLTDPRWIEENPETAAELYTDHEAFLSRIDLETVDSQQTFSQITSWVRKKARAGCRFIAVDPITAAQTTRRDIWAEHNEFLQQVKQIAVDYSCSILFVTHPVKAVSFPDLNQLSGSAAFGRFCQCVLWLEYLDEPIEGDVRTSIGTAPMTYNRVLHFLKVRNGCGQGLRMACMFTADLLLQEKGIVVRKVKK